LKPVLTSALDWVEGACAKARQYLDEDVPAKVADADMHVEPRREPEVP
jgi:hypothetical protein